MGKANLIYMEDSPVGIKVILNRLSYRKESEIRNTLEKCYRLVYMFLKFYQIYWTFSDILTNIDNVTEEKS
uniref:Uncharacterized protein n=1 Tax=Megaselia scalaris TaxID=36166 RepID=T1GYU3_MEGSC